MSYDPRRLAALALVLLAATACGKSEPAATQPSPPVTTTPAQPSRDDLGSTLKNLATAEEAYALDKGTYTTSLAALEAEGFTPEPGVTPKVLRADRDGYCVSASGAGAVLYFDSDAGTVSRTSCA